MKSENRLINLLYSHNSFGFCFSILLANGLFQGNEHFAAFKQHDTFTEFTSLELSLSPNTVGDRDVCMEECEFLS